jgi:hypothetical protein
MIVVTAEPRILQGVGHRLLRDRPQRPAPATNPRHHGTPKTPDMFRKGTTLKITMIAALSIATAATALPMAAIAHADGRNIVSVMALRNPSTTH